METKFYQFNQNNSGGSFVVNNELCHRLFIEASIYKEALDKALELGVYFDGCSTGEDCSCCGDRWYHADEVNLSYYKDKGYTVSTYLSYHEDPNTAIGNLNNKYKDATWITAPNFKDSKVSGGILVKNVEEYAQILANEYGWTTPDARIFYKDGRVIEINKKE